MNKVELLAPAGCEENFYAAINFGADAVYLGLSDFSARKNAGNFTLERLPYIVAYAHLFNVKVYVTVNTVIKDNELNEYFNYIATAAQCGVDAFIVQDVFLGRALKRVIPNITLHLSTQAGVNNVDGAKQALSYGFSRVILARETSISQIKEIAKIIETEVFIHGALCTCFSGHCYFSSFIGGQSGNRGRCRQPCRKLYKYEGQAIKDNMRYALSLSDLSLARRMEELILAGVKSFKIEGRMRSFEYVCAVCDYYREIIDSGTASKVKLDNLKRFYNRGGYTEGMTFGQSKSLLSDKMQNHAGSVIGIVSAVKGNKIILSSVKHEIKEGDCFKIISSGEEVGNAIAVNENGQISLLYRRKAFIGCQVAITKDVSLMEKYRLKKKLAPVTARFYCREGERLKLVVNGVEFFSDHVIERSINSPTTKSELKDNLRKIDKFPFAVTPSCDMEGTLFVPKKVANELRARAYKSLFYGDVCDNIKNIETAEKLSDFYNFYVSDNCIDESGIAIIASDFSFKIHDEYKHLIFCPDDYCDAKQIDKFFHDTRKSSAKKYLYVPAFINDEDEKIIAKIINKFDGVYCEGSSGVFLAKRYGKGCFGGIELNVTNRMTYRTAEQAGVYPIALSKELSYSELEKFDSGWILSLGGIKIMSLMYCPFGKNCSTCKKTAIFQLKDADGRVFKVRKYKLSSCRFEIYNDRMIKGRVRSKCEIFDLTMLKASEVNEIIDKYLNGIKDEKHFYTVGNLLKGVE